MTVLDSDPLAAARRRLEEARAPSEGAALQVLPASQDSNTPTLAPLSQSNASTPGWDLELLLELSARRLVRGCTILDAPECVESNWGEGHRSLWARGEPFLLCGPDGVGKTTVAQQLVLKLCGLGEPSLLGLPVRSDRRVLYLALDRPSQALRSFRRMVGPDDRQLLEEHLALWEGPLPFDLPAQPGSLLALARRAGADAVVIDSLKDAAMELCKEETGQGLNKAFQILLRRGRGCGGSSPPTQSPAGRSEATRSRRGVREQVDHGGLWFGSDALGRARRPRGRFQAPETAR